MSGQIWKYSDKLDEWDLEFAQKQFITYREGIEYYGLTEKSIVRLAREAGAVYKIDSKMVRIRRDLFEAYLRKKYRICENTNRDTDCKTAGESICISNGKKSQQGGTT